MLNLSEVLAALANVKGVTLAEITYKTPLNPSKRQDGSLTRNTVRLGVSVESLYLDDIAKLQGMEGLDGLDSIARDTILASRQKSLQVGIGNNPDYTCQGVYTHVEGIEGVKIHKETGALYVTGLSLSREVLESGVTLPQVNSAPLTLAKRNIEKHLASSKFRQWTLKNIQSVSIYDNILKVVASGE